MLFLQKQDKNIEKNKENGNERLPYFRLVQAPEKEGGEWIELGAFWKSKSGKGYSGNFAKNIKLEILPKEPSQSND